MPLRYKPIIDYTTGTIVGTCHPERTDGGQDVHVLVRRLSDHDTFGSTHGMADPVSWFENQDRAEAAIGNVVESTSSFVELTGVECWTATVTDARSDS